MEEKGNSMNENTETQSCLQSLVAELEETRNKVEEEFGEDDRTLKKRFGWNCPDFGKEEIIYEINGMLTFIETHRFETTSEFESLCDKSKNKLLNWRNESLPNLMSNGYAFGVFGELCLILTYVQNILRNASPEFDSLLLQTKANDIHQTIDGLTIRLGKSTEETENIEAVTKRILEADRAARALPETVQTLEQARNQAVETEKTVNEQAANIASNAEKAKDYVDEIDQIKTQAKEILDRCETALASSTSAGLAHSFNERKEELQEKEQWWTWCLIGALATAVICVWWRADRIFDLLDKGSSVGSFTLLANFLVSIAFVGAPIWLAWVSTKQIGYYFRLSEDYAFKATVSASYEGFRRETENKGDGEFTKKVLSSTLDRYDEAPLRFVDTRVSGSPYQELMESPIVSKFLKTAPDAVKAIQEFAQERLEKVVGKTAEKVVDAAEKAVVEK